MARIQFLAGKRDEMKDLASGLVIAVDIGFGQDNKRSCGLAWKHGAEKPEVAEAFEFASAIAKACELLRPENSATLIIEAPLFALFSASGNPIRRGDFEKRPEKELNHRYWYTNAGAVTCLAAIFFLREMKNRLLANKDSTVEIAVHLYEGFISFKTKPSTQKKADKEKAHMADARRLLNCFYNPESAEIVVVEPEAEQPHRVLADIIIDNGKLSEIPVILKP